LDNKVFDIIDARCNHQVHSNTLFSADTECLRVLYVPQEKRWFSFLYISSFFNKAECLLRGTIWHFKYKSFYFSWQVVLLFV